LQSANLGNEKPSCHEAESAKFLDANPGKLRDLSQKMKNGQVLKKSAPKLKKLELNSTNLKLKHAKTFLNCTKSLIQALFMH
jgi:hypothetical protein